MLTMKYGEIVKYNGELGKLVTEDKKFYFLPVNYGGYYCSNLEEVTENNIEETTIEEKIHFNEMEFSWGTVVKTHCIGKYQIIEYKDDRDNSICYSIYINFKGIGCSYNTLDTALIGVIAHNSLEVNTAHYATSFILKMLNKTE